MTPTLFAETVRQALKNIASNKFRTLLTMLGIIIGIALGYLIAAAANQVLPLVLTDMDLTISPSAASVAIAFGISAGIGVLFGYLPAKRAARLNPIDALHYD